MTETTPEQRAAIIAAGKLATPRPWTTDEQNDYEDYCIWGPEYTNQDGTTTAFIANIGADKQPVFDLMKANADYVTLAANHADALAKQVERLEGEVQAWTDCADSFTAELASVRAVAEEVIRIATRELSEPVWTNGATATLVTISGLLQGAIQRATGEGRREFDPAEPKAAQSIP